MEWIVAPLGKTWSLDLLAADKCSGGGSTLLSCECTGGLVVCQCEGGLTKPAQMLA